MAFSNQRWAAVTASTGMPMSSVVKRLLAGEETALSFDASNLSDGGEAMAR